MLLFQSSVIFSWVIAVSDFPSILLVKVVALNAEMGGREIFIGFKKAMNVLFGRGDWCPDCCG